MHKRWRSSLVGVAVVAIAVVVAVGATRGPAAAATKVQAHAARTAATPTLAQIKKSGTLRVGLAVDPPFTLRDPSGKWYSFNPSLVQKLAAQLHVKLELVAAGWPTLVAGLQTNHYDMIGASISATPERRKAINFTVPYAFGGTSWIVKKGNGLNSVNALNSSKVTIAFNTNTFQEEITRKLMPQAHYRAIPNASYADLLSEIQANHSQAITIPSFLTLAITKQFSWAQAVPKGTKGLEPTGVAWGVNKGAENATFLAYLNRFIKQQTNNGTIKQLMAKYITIANSLKG